MEFSRKYNKREVKINELGWNLQQNIYCRVKKLESFSVKPTGKYFLAFSKKKNASVCYIIWCSSKGRFYRITSILKSTYLYRFDLEKTQFPMTYKDLNISFRSKEINNEIIFPGNRNINFPGNWRKIIFQCELFGKAIFSEHL